MEIVKEKLEIDEVLNKKISNVYINDLENYINIKDLENYLKIIPRCGNWFIRKQRLKYIANKGCITVIKTLV